MSKTSTIKRNIAKPATVAKPAVKTATITMKRNLTVSKPATGKIVLQVPAIARTIKSPSGVASRGVRIRHDISSSYAGPRATLNITKSRTPLRFADFARFPDRTLTERQETLLRDLRRKYSRNPFERGNLDVGIMNALITKGVVVHVSGKPTDEDARMRLAV